MQLRAPATTRPPWRQPDERRTLQLVLATFWLFDGILQLQPVMFTRQFGTTMLAPMARGNPGPVAHSITWAAHLVASHSATTDACFAAIQIALGLAIAWRPTVKAGLAASIVWAGTVWWFGEGLGGVIAGTANTVGGAPGAVLLYAVLAVLLWPSDRVPDAPFTAARAVGEPVARLLWLALWGGLSLLAVLGSNRSPEGLRHTVQDLSTGEPPWLAALDQHVANLLGQRGLAAAIVLSAVLAVIAVGVYLPPQPARVALVLAVAVALVIWVLGQNFGSVFSGSATDLNSGPLLVLFALTYRRRRPRATPPAETRPSLAMEMA